jgi:hypothetical protein
MKLKFVFSAMATLVLSTGSAFAQSAPLCGLHTIRGTYAFKNTGRAQAPGQPPGTFVDLAFVGIATFDGNGQVTIVNTGSIGGQIIPKVVPPPGVYSSYTVNEDCSGKFSGPAGTGGGDLYIGESGKTIFVIFTTPGQIVTGEFRRL